MLALKALGFLSRTALIAQFRAESCDELFSQLVQLHLTQYMRACGVSHNSRLKRATGLRCRP